MFISTLVCVIIALVSGLTYYVKRKFSFWRNRGIPHDTPKFPYGNMAASIKGKCHLRDVMKMSYDKFKGQGPFIGMYMFTEPIVLALDLDFVKDVLIKDFHNFADRGMYYNERDDPLSAHLFGLDGPKWKNLRSKLSPTFTLGKMKYMFPTVVQVGDQLVDTLNKVIEDDGVLEIKDFLARYSTDVIGSCAFGIVCNSLENPDTDFRTHGAKAFTLKRHHKIVETFIIIFADLSRKLGMRIIHEDIHKFFMGLVRATVDYREKNSIKRNDFLDLMLELKNSEDGMTVEEIAAQAFIFFFAGFETSSSTMGFTLFELAVNQDIQDKLRAEIDEQFKKHDGKFTYECMADMHYMDKVVKETLRKHSVCVTLLRKCLNDYQTRDPKFIIPKGMRTLIQVDAIHRDPEIYPDPEKFDPERFSAEEVQKRHPASYLPFGNGPRNCIGWRFGIMQICVGLTLLLRNFKFFYSEKTPNPLIMDETQPLLAVKGGIYLRVERIKKHFK